MTFRLLAPSTLLLLVVLGSPLRAQLQERMSLTGTRASFIPPTGFHQVNGLPLFASGSFAATLVVREFSEPLDSITSRPLTSLGLFDDRIRPVSRSDVIIAGMRGTRLVFERSEGSLVSRRALLEILAVGDSAGTLAVVLAYSDSVATADRDSLFASTRSIEWDRSRPLDPLSLLNCTLTPAPPFALAMANSNALVFAPDGDATPDATVRQLRVMRLSTFRSTFTEQDRRLVVDDVLAAITRGMPSPDVVEHQQVETGGMRAHEVVASVRSEGEDGAVWYFVAVLFHPRTPIAVIGLTAVDDPEADLAAFRTMARSIRRVRLAEEGALPCRRLLETGLMSEALGCFEEVLRAEPSSRSAQLGRADALRQSGQLRPSIAAYSEMLSRDDAIVEAYVGRARALTALSEHRWALRDLDRAVTLEPLNADMRLLRADAREQTGDLPGAANDLETVIRSSPTSAALHVRLGSLLTESSRSDEAVEVLNRAIALDSSGAAAWEARALAFQRSGDLDRSVADLREALRRAPSRGDLRRRRGHQLLTLGDYEQAVRELNAAVASEPKPAEALALRGLAHGYLGRMTSAWADLEASLKLDPDGDRVYYERGVLRCLNGLFKEAAADLQKGVGMRSGGTPRIWLYVAQARTYGKELAMRHLRRYRDGVRNAYGPRIDDVEFVLGERSEDALVRAAETAERREARSQFYFSLGLWHWHTGTKSQARRYWRLVVDIGVRDQMEYHIARAYLAQRWKD